MSRVLIVESERVLQQALSLALISEHEVTILNALPENGADGLKEFDLIIIDATALRAAGSVTPQTTQAIESSDVPTLWLEEFDSPQAPQRAKLTVLKKPIEKEAFDSAITGLLTVRKSSKQEPERARVRKEKEKGIPEQESFQFIDLVDIVEEGSQSEQHGKDPRKS